MRTRWAARVAQFRLEVKFWYSADKVTRLIEEVGADHSLSLNPTSPYDRILAVIWDDARRTEEHGELIRGLETRSVLGVVTILGQADAVPG